jgi:hypothetical protein
MSIYRAADTVSFKDYLFRNKRNRATLFAAAIIIIIQFSILKYFYPYASYIHGDSFSYLDGAYQNLSINTYMIGYSMFLRIFSVFSNSDFALTAFQYVFLQASSLFLLFTLFYLYRPGRITQTILLCFIVFNPLFLFMGNLVSSDALFASLSLIWFTLLIWIMYKPTPKLIIWHTLVIYLAFTVRYNALIYIFISAAAFLLSSFTIKNKLIGIGSGCLVIALFILHTSNEYKSLTGTWQYSPFAGWQWANNAMYAYRYVDSSQRKPVPARFQALDNSIRRYFDSTRDVKKYPLESVMASTYYMWSPGLPLFRYRNNLYKKVLKDSTSTELKKWSSMGPLYTDYGLYIISRYPTYFARYFLWPNANKYYAPPVEFLAEYNSGKDSVTNVAKVWFKYKSRRLTTRTKNLKITILDFYPILSGVINVIMLFGLISFFLLDGFKSEETYKKGILLGGIVWLLNAGFTIFASSVALRFQAFPIILTTIFTGVIVDWLWQMASIKTQPENKPQLSVAL